jgi:D-proline reductase (dithiol) PrdB
MPFQYLPIMAANAAPKPPRELVLPSKRAWCSVPKDLRTARVALLSSAALRLAHQQPFIPREDLSYRLVPADPDAGDIVIDNHSGIGKVPKQDPEIVFPRSALAALVKGGTVGASAPYHISFMGGVRRQREIEVELAPAIAGELVKQSVDLALLVPY